MGRRNSRTRPANQKQLLQLNAIALDRLRARSQLGTQRDIAPAKLIATLSSGRSKATSSHASGRFIVAAARAQGSSQADHAASRHDAAYFRTSLSTQARYAAGTREILSASSRGDRSATNI